MIKLLIASFVMLNATQVFGVARSENWFQAEKGEMFSELNFGYLDTDFEAGGAESNYNSMDAFVSFELGLTENVSWFSNVGYFMAEGVIDFDGTRALSTGIRLQQRYQSGRFISLFQISHELEKGRLDNQNGSVLSLSAGGGYEHFFDKDLVGVFVQVPFLTTDFELSGQQPVVTKGVPSLSLYAETHRIDSIVVGLKADYVVSGGNLQKEYRLSDGSGKFQMLNSLIYARYEASTKLSLLASGGYNLSLSEDDTAIDGVQGFQAGLGARYKF